MRRPGPHHKKTCSNIFFLCSVFGPLHLHQDFPNCSLSSSSHSIRYLCALIAFHQRINVGISAIGLSLVTFFGIEKNIVVQARCGHLPPCSTFSKNSTISLLVSFVKSRLNFGWQPSHPTPVFALYNLEAFSKSQYFSLGKASSNFFKS